jgi:hypothetical protein
MTNPELLIAAILALAVSYVLLPIVFPVLRRFWGGRLVKCPETGKGVGVCLDGQHAVLSSAVGRPHLRVKDCPLWPRRRGCPQGCIRELQTNLSEA